MRVITLCGSSRFKDVFDHVNKSLTLQGNVVISLGVFGHSEGITIDEPTKQLLDEVHKKKIDFCDDIMVINVGGYIGESTKKEIEYAKSLNKNVLYFEPRTEEQ